MEAMILVAHADDEALGVGGTIPKLVAKGWDTRVVFVSSGIVQHRGQPQDNRPAAKEACRLLGVPEPLFLGFKDQAFDAVSLSDIINAIYALGRDPDLIITHGDADMNNDHRLVCEAAKVFGRPRRKPVSILGCEVPGSAFWNGRPFAANYYTDISTTVDLKVDAFARYENELRPYPDPWSRKGLKLLAESHGMHAGFAFAEAFEVIRAYEGRLP